MLRLEGVDKTFPVGRSKVTALRGVSLAVKPGLLTSVLGPSGSGKSTVLRVMAGFERPERGRVTLSGRELVGPGVFVRPELRGIGIVPQDGALFPHLDVADNVAFGLARTTRQRLSRSAGRARAERVEELLRLVGLEGYQRRRVDQLSGGQQQRVALARALAVDPKVLLLDEPFGALDANVRRELRRSLRDIHDALGITTLFVTHDQEEALDLADRVVILDHGRIVQEGTPQQVCRAPSSAFVTRFLGDANRLVAEVRGGRALIAGGSIEAAGVPDGRAEIYARPADIEWAREGAGIAARVIRVMDRPESRRLVARLPGGEHVELDVTPETAVGVGDSGVVTLRRANVFALA